MSAATETPNQTGPATDPCPRCGAPVRADQDWCLECGAPARSRVARAPSWRVPAAIVAAIILLAGAGVAVAFATLSDDSTHVAASLTTPTTAPAPDTTSPTTSTPATATSPASPGTSTTPTTPGAATTPNTPTTPGATTTPATPTTPGAATTPTTPATTTPAPAKPVKPATAAIGTWPAGRSGYTVIMVSATSRARARRAAERFAAEGIHVGILSSSHYSSLEPGYEVVFSGRYPSLARAQAEAERLQQRGAEGAYGRYVKSGG